MNIKLTLRLSENNIGLILPDALDDSVPSEKSVFNKVVCHNNLSYKRRYKSIIIFGNIKQCSINMKHLRHRSHT